MRHAMAQLVAALRYGLEGCRFNGIFHWPNPSSRTIAPESTQPLTQTSTSSTSSGVKAAGA